MYLLISIIVAKLLENIGADPKGCEGKPVLKKLLTEGAASCILSTIGGGLTDVAS